MRFAAIGWLAGAGVAAAALTACNLGGDTGYVEIKTVPVAPLTQTALYLGSKKLAPIRKGSVLLRQSVGTLTLQTESYAPGMLAPLCDIVVAKNRITSVTVSVIGPPRCQCRATGTDDATARACVS